MKEDKLTKQVGGFDTKKYYISPQINSEIIEFSHSLLAGSTTKTVKDKGMQEQWEEETIEETFTWTW